jgi:Uma2 family endonuclease
MSYARVPDPGRITFDEYLDLEAESPVKHEFVGGRIYAFAGASRPHNQIVGNIYAQLWDAALETSCEVFGSDMLLRLSPRAAYYPDITIVCDPEDDDPRFTSYPCLLVEVLSPATMDRDRREKLLAYLGIESLRGYLLVDQHRRHVELHWRDHDDVWRHGEWHGDGRVPIPCLDTTLDLGDIYRRVPELSGG